MASFVTRITRVGVLREPGPAAAANARNGVGPGRKDSAFQNRSCILNGIEEIVTRPDLADRAVFLTLQPIPEEHRRPDVPRRSTQCMPATYRWPLIWV
jgi:hypothetical protein